MIHLIQHRTLWFAYFWQCPGMHPPGGERCHVTTELSRRASVHTECEGRTPVVLAHLGLRVVAEVWLLAGLALQTTGLVM